MPRGIRAKDVANMVGEPDWDNSDASSDEEDYSILDTISEDPLQQVEDATMADEDSDDSHETNIESTSAHTEAEPTLDSLVTSCTSGFSALPVTPFNEPVGSAIAMPNSNSIGLFQCYM